MLKKLWEKIRDFWAVADEVARGKAVETIEVEVEEMEHVFGLLVLGSFVGVPAPPVHISLELMPWMERELRLMLERVEVANEPLARLFSTLEIG